MNLHYAIMMNIYGSLLGIGQRNAATVAMQRKHFYNITDCFLCGRRECYIRSVNLRVVGGEFLSDREGAVLRVSC
jgi:hypothetical protein